MIIKNIYSNDILVAKDYLIKFAIKNGFQYIDIDNELHIENKIIFRFYNNEITLNNLINENIMINVEDSKYASIDFKPCIQEVDINYNIRQVPKFKKQDYLRESIKTKRVIKKRGIK